MCSVQVRVQVQVQACMCNCIHVHILVFFCTMCGEFLFFFSHFLSPCIYFFFGDFEKFEIKFFLQLGWVLFCPLSPLFFGPSLRLDVGPCGEFGNRVHGCTSGSSLWVIYTEREEEKPFWSHVIKKSLLGSVNILGSVRV